MAADLTACRQISAHGTLTAAQYRASGVSVGSSLCMHVAAQQRVWSSAAQCTSSPLHPVQCSAIQEGSAAAGAHALCTGRRRCCAQGRIGWGRRWL